MKVAVIIAGLPRTFSRTIKNFRRMLNGMDVDTYIFTWIDHYTKEVSDTYQPKGVTLGCWGDVSPLLDEKVKFFETLKWDKTKGYAKGHFNLKTGVLAQWYGVKRAYETIEKPSEYDLIIRYRFDWNPLFEIDWHDIENNHMYELVHSGMKHHGIGQYKINDMFAIARPLYMLCYSQLFDYLMSDMYNEAIEKNNCFIPEFILAYHLQNFRIKTYSNPEYKYRLER